MSFTANIDEVVAKNRNKLLGVHASWKRTRLKEIATILNGYPFESSRFSREKGTPLIRIRDILPGQTETLFNGEFDSTFLVQPGEIVVGMDGDFHCAPWSGVPALLNQRVCKITPDEARFSKQFLRYVLPGYLNAINAETPSVTVKHLSSRTVADIPLPLPPLPEQHRIVSEIEKQFTRLEAGVAALRRVQANLKRYRAAVLKAACEGKLVPTEAELTTKNAKSTKTKPASLSASSAISEVKSPRFETGEALLARILTERRQWFDKQQVDAKTKRKYIEPARPDAANLPPLPEGWTLGTWNQLSNWVTYGFTRPMPHVDEGIPIITAKGVSRGRIDFDGADLTTKEAYVKLSEKDRPQPRDILITKDGTIGRAAVVDTGRVFCINQSVAVIWLRSCPMERKFLLTVIESELTQKPIWAKARGVAIQHLSITDFAKMALPIPPLAEQRRIVAEVERRLSVVEELESVVSANLQRAARLRQSILQKAFTGEVCAPVAASTKGHCP